MILPLSAGLKLHLRKPIAFEHVAPPQLELRLPRDARPVTLPPVPDGYRLRTLRAEDAPAIVRLLQRAGFDFDANALDRALLLCLPSGCFVIEHAASGTLCSTMMARHLATPEHPYGGRIDWLATDPDHRKRGLAAICARGATRRLIDAGYQDIWVTTDDHRPGAIKTFLGIGFVPAVTPETENRWQQLQIP